MSIELQNTAKKKAVYVEKVCRKFQYVVLAYG
ncbi:uncharacterized protein METZ01_LOCUS281560 [marine metagenome]|uniref:Uncharacterized protein n=1 Tax=marine metagenome TaxID=408172 RepID=A0A382KWB0_9ZZZZ